MISLVLHLRGPMQAWGGNSRLDIRSTELLPTKSALVGILASAHGRTHGSDVSDLVQLEMVIRVDQPGWLMRDYHTVGAGYPKGQRIQKAKGGERPEDKSTLVSERYYLADAAFTITLTGDDLVIKSTNTALERPRWAPALGRRSCPPAEPFNLGIIDKDPVEYLSKILPVVRDVSKGQSRLVTFVKDIPDGDCLLYSDFHSVRDIPNTILNDWRYYSERKMHRWIEELDKNQFTADPLTLILR